MPTRYLRPGIRDSELIDGLTPAAEILFYRLIVTVDDFGRFDARPAMVKSQCFPIRDAMTATKVGDLLRELGAAGLIAVYEVGGKPYLQMQKWDNAPRARESKFPAAADGCMQTYTSARKPHADADTPRTVLPVTETVTETGTETETETVSLSRSRATKKCPAGFDLTDGMREWAVDNAPAVDIDKATDSFRDYTFARSITDWPAAWRNWMRKAQERAATRPAAAAQRETFRERDERLAREKWEQITGRRRPGANAVIDITPTDEPPFLQVEQ